MKLEFLMRESENFYLFLGMPKGEAKIQKFDEIIKTLPVVHRETLRT